MLFLGADYEKLGFSPEQIQERMGRWFAWNNKMYEQGIVKMGEALAPGGKRISGENKTVTDGPFAESKEVVGGFYVITVENYEAAVAIAQDYPDYDTGGTVEIREVMVYDTNG